MKRFVSWTVGAVVLCAVVSVFGSTPIESLITGQKCTNPATYWDDVDNVCVHGDERIEEIAGVKLEQVGRVLEGSRDALFSIKGVTATGIDRHGPYVEVDAAHDTIPLSVGGIPLHVKPAVTRMAANHTIATPERPYHGGAAIGTSQTLGFNPPAICTGGPSVLDENGYLWQLLPSHCLVNACQSNALYSLPHAPNALHNISRNQNVGTFLYQPSAAPVQNVGYVQAWDRIFANSQANWGPDLAVVATRNSTPDRTNMLPVGQWYPTYRPAVDQVVGNTSFWQVIHGQRAPTFGDTGLLWRGDILGSGFHTVSGWVSNIGQTVPVQTQCVVPGGVVIYYEGDQFTFSAAGTQGYPMGGGDSGSPIVGGAVNELFYLGMMKWVVVSGGQTTSLTAGGSTSTTEKIYAGYKTLYDGDSTFVSLTLDVTSQTFAPGTISTAWADVKNLGASPATHLKLKLMNPVSGVTFTYVNPDGQNNTPWNTALAPGATARFMIALSSAVARPAFEYVINALGDNVVAPTLLPGENTYTAAWIANSVNPVVRVAAGLNADDSIHIAGGPLGYGGQFFSFWNNSTVNSTVTISPNVGLSPLTVYSCRWDTTGAGACQTPLVQGEWFDIVPPNITYIYMMWMTGQGYDIPLNYYANRAYFQVKNLSGQLIGSVARAVETQWCTTNCAPQ